VPHPAATGNAARPNVATCGNEKCRPPGRHHSRSPGSLVSRGGLRLRLALRLAPAIGRSAVRRGAGIRTLARTRIRSRRTVAALAVVRAVETRPLEDHSRHADLPLRRRPAFHALLTRRSIEALRLFVAMSFGALVLVDRQLWGSPLYKRSPSKGSCISKYSKRSNTRQQLRSHAHQSPLFLQNTPCYTSRSGLTKEKLLDYTCIYENAPRSGGPLRASNPKVEPENAQVHLH